MAITTEAQRVNIQHIEARLKRIFENDQTANNTIISAEPVVIEAPDFPSLDDDFGMSIPFDFVLIAFEIGLGGLRPCSFLALTTTWMVDPGSRMGIVAVGMSPRSERVLQWTGLPLEIV